MVRFGQEGFLFSIFHFKVGFAIIRMISRSLKHMKKIESQEYFRYEQKHKHEHSHKHQLKLKREQGHKHKTTRNRREGR